MMTPKRPGGAIEGAKVDCLLAQKKLEQALGVYGGSSPEGQAILKAITALTKAFGKAEGDTESLMPAELKQMMMGMQGAPGGGAPGGPPGGAPGGAPKPMMPGMPG
jgi:hypothetical protein